MPGCAAYQVRSTLTSIPLSFTLRKWEGKKGPNIGWSRVLSYNLRSLNTLLMPYKAQILCKTSQRAIKGRVHTWFPGAVPEYGTRWAQT